MKKGHPQDASVHGQSGDAESHSKLSLTKSKSNPPGPVLPPPTTVIASVATPRVEGVLSQPTTNPASPFPSIGAETSYFSSHPPDAQLPRRTGRTTREHPHLAIPTDHHPKGHNDGARRGLYGSTSRSGTPQDHDLNFSKEDSKFVAPPPRQRNDAVYRKDDQLPRPTFPSYPNQSYAALQTKTFSSPPNPNFRPSSSLTVQPFPPPSRTLAPAGVDLLRERKPKPSANPSAQLYAAPSITAPHQFGLEGAGEPSPYRSPYLHRLQSQPPKTTTNARKDVDVFSGRKIINHYEILGELGRGVHGKVKLARDLERGGEQVAIKIVQRYSKKKRLGKSSNPEDKVKKEVAILKKVQHPNVVRMLEVIDDPQEAKVYIVLEFCEWKEINWRKLGSSEIVVLENRRLDRESRGLPEEDVITQEDKALKAARRRLEKTRSRPSRNQRTRSVSYLWSLEYGGESEDEETETETETDDSPQDQMFRDQSREEGDFSLSGSPTAHGRYSHVQDSPIASKNSPLRSLNSPNDIPASATGSSVGSTELSRQNSFGTHLQRWSLPMSGNSPHHDRGRRHGSIAESITSQMTQWVIDEIPEDLRYVPTMTIPECRAAFRDALVGLDYLHYHGIIHRDIKPANLLRTRDYRVKISDFGVSYLGKPIRDGEESADTSESESRDLEEETELAKNVGTPAFYAPELCSLDLVADAPAVTGQIDVWALGATLYCLLFARTPFLADNEFALMRRVAEEEVFIPRLRLKAVDLRTDVRSSSRGHGHVTSEDKRQPGEYLHEEIDDILYDLLKKLFVKDPKKRIKIHEIKRHPWVLADLPDPMAWFDETDQGRQEQGRKIEISSKEVENAVIPISIVKRIRSITSRAGRALGFSGGRKRGNSSATSSEAGSATGSVLHLPDNIQSRRSSLHPDSETLNAALRLAHEQRDNEITEQHPLSRSVTASPDESPRESFDAYSYPSSPVAQRPPMGDRNASEVSGTGSTRTVRQQSYFPIDRRSSAASIYGDAQHTILEEPGATGLGLWGGHGRSLARALHDQEVMDPSDSGHFQTHDSEHGARTPSGGPSLVLSTPLIEGHVDHFSASMSTTPYESPLSSRKSSVVASHVASPVSSQPRRQSALPSTSDLPVISHEPDSAFPYLRGPTTEEDFQQAIENNSRRRLLEIQQSEEWASASRSASRPTTSSGRAPDCPPSPDDDERSRNARSISRPSRPAFGSSNPSRTISSASSEGHLGSAGLSQSTSYPSVPSVMSANTSLPETEYYEIPPKPTMDTHSSSGSTVNPSDPALAAELDQLPDSHDPAEDIEDGYAVETDDDCDDSDADDDFLEMSHRNSTRQGLTRSGSISNAQLARRNVLRTKSYGRSGSTHTMKHVRSHSSGSSGQSKKTVL